MGKDLGRVPALVLLAMAALLVSVAAAAEEAGQPDAGQRKDALELRRDADDIEKRLATSGLLYGNVELDAYVQSVADGLRRPDDPQSASACTYSAGPGRTHSSCRTAPAT